MYSTDPESLAWIITPIMGNGPCAAPHLPTCLTALLLLDPKSAVFDLRFPFPLALAQSWFFCLSPAAKIFICFFTLKLVSFQLACLFQLKGPPLTTPKTQHQCGVGNVWGGVGGKWEGGEWGGKCEGRCDIYLNGYFKKTPVGCLGLFCLRFFLLTACVLSPRLKGAFEPASADWKVVHFDFKNSMNSAMW